MDSARIVDLGILGTTRAALGVYLSWRAFIVFLTSLEEKEQRRHKYTILRPAV